jgi:Rrf2 family iron-sulfur cluster assembly transcriptional regulator
MKISKNGQYALLSACDLAMQHSHSSIADIAERHGINKGYLSQIILSLKKAGVVASVRGKGGGYRLGKSPSLLTAGEVIRAAEGELKPTQCSANDAHISCAAYGSCVTRALWQRISKEINDTLDSITIENITEIYMKGKSPCD